MSKTHMIIAILLDESGSMLRNKLNALEGVNEYIDTIKADYEAKPEAGEVFFSLITFNSSYDNKDRIKFIHNLRPIKEVESIPESAYNPAGGTPLLEALGRTIESLDELEKDTLPSTNPLVSFLNDAEETNYKIVVVVQTDGMNTDIMGDYTKDKISQMVKDRESKGNWTFVFLGADIDAIHGGNQIGLKAGSTYAFGGTVGNPVSYKSVYGASAVATSSLRHSPNLSTTNYVEEMSKIIEKEKKEPKK